MPAYSRILLPWDSQPQEPVGVDLNNPLMRGVVEVYVPPWMGGGTLIASPVRTEAGTIERTTRAIGRGRVMNSSSYDSWADAGLSAAFTQQLTWFALLDIDSHTAGSFIIGNVEAASTGYNHGLYINNSKFPTFFVKTGGVGASAIGSAVITAVGPIAMVGTYDGATMVVHSHTYSTGLYQRATTAKTGNLDTTTFPVTVGRWNGGFGGMAGTFYVGGVVRGVWTDQHVREFFSNPWQIFAPRSIWVPVSQAAAGGPVSGSLAATESGADVAALAGDVLVSGSLAATESGGDTAALAGTIAVVGALAATESGSDTAALQGLLGAGPVTGSITATESGSDVAALAGLVAIVGTLDAAESGSDTASFRAPSSAQEVYGSTGYWPSPRRKTKREIDDERRRRLGLPVEVLEAVAAAPVERRKVVLADLIGKPKAARITRVDLSEAITLHKRRKRQRDDEMLMLM